MSYGAEYWPIKINNINRMESTQMRMLEIICGKTLEHRVNEQVNTQGDWC